MSKFPRDEAGMLALAREMSDGFSANTEVYPAPPVVTDALDASLGACESARDAVQTAKAALEEAVAAKQAAFASLEEEMRTDIRYAENTVHFDDAKLKLIGWSGRKHPTPMKVPGQVRSLVAREQGEETVTLAWKKPADGGKVAAYRVQCRESAQGVPWSGAEMAMETEITLSGQERGKELEYRVLAVNKAGEGEPSNTVMVVL
uniref:Fibronectin type III domain-containing protein n=1 Tax=Candidatus Kentrum eta TaxID=2126337 RepID=A0A450V012_9GAMM|nr:MAG: Fibronectin type III domain-containing protein [Candidatus Kentron sp. H]VFK00163.1 MAG: Fibronectin type III domain-containing protein [Candidatus Kentron sp. H]VFK03374.1 MAG: Fibronectin type III domain-containing protein [Candidatus Kentron sp. H]